MPHAIIIHTTDVKLLTGMIPLDLFCMFTYGSPSVCSPGVLTVY